MAHGGRRSGAGRKKGAATQRTREIADQAASDGGALPLDVLIAVMRFHYGAANAELARGKEADVQALVNSFDAAREAAKDAAPYIHPRLQAHEHKGPDDGPIRIEIVWLPSES